MPYDAQELSVVVAWRESNMGSTTAAVRGLVIGAGAAVMLFGGASAALADHRDVPPGDTFQPVTFCHAAPPDNPNRYVTITTDNAAVIVGHSQQHDGDIIPPFEYVDANDEVQSFPGQNTDQLDVIENGCVVPTPTTTPPPTTTSTTTTTTSTSPTETSPTETSPTRTSPTRTSPGQTTTPARPIPSGGVDTGNSGLVDDGSFNAPAALGLLGALGLAGGTAVAIRRRRSFNA